MDSVGTIQRTFQISKRLLRSFENRAYILVYHRVASLDSDPWWLAVTPEHFAEHMDVLQREYLPLPLEQLPALLDKGRLPLHAVFVTFDDGYADVLQQAQPLLDRFEIPATVFIPGCAVDSPREFWWDELEGILLKPGLLPEQLQITISGKTYFWQLSEYREYHPEDVAAHREWRTKIEPPTIRHTMYRSLWELLHPLPTGERLEILDLLHDWSGTSPRPRSEYRTLNSEEVLALDNHPLTQIGAHSMTHPQLSALPLTEQQVEIQQSKAQLEGVLNHPVDCFSYPFGKASDYTGETIRLVREAGFSSAVTNFPGRVTRRTDIYQLPRIYVPDWNGKQFAFEMAKRFKRFYGVLREW